jgi:hypothetical protein
VRRRVVNDAMIVLFFAANVMLFCYFSTNYCYKVSGEIGLASIAQFFATNSPASLFLFLVEPFLLQ